LPINCYLSEITELKYTSLIKIIIKEENYIISKQVQLKIVFHLGSQPSHYSMACPVFSKFTQTCLRGEKEDPS